jgi:hypothetical protein
MKPPTFEEAKEPLAADVWIKATEAKFSVFVLPCSEECRPASRPYSSVVQRCCGESISSP